MIQWRIRVGRWERLYPTVFRLAGAQRSWRQDALAACFHFGPGAAVSFRSAAALRGVSHLKRIGLEITVPRGRNRRGLKAVMIHSEPGGVSPVDITTIDGIPVTKPARTLLDLAAVEPEEVVGHILDEWLRRRLISLRYLEGWLAARSRPRGAPMLRRLIDDRATIGVNESPLESRFLKLLRSTGLPMPILQYVVTDEGRFVARPDFAYPEQRVAIEADSFKFHDRRLSFDAERARGNDLQALGWLVLRITSKHLDEDPEGVAWWVRRALDNGFWHEPTEEGGRRSARSDGRRRVRTKQPS